MSKELKGRDHLTKQALIDYLSLDTDERFWQAIANFGEMWGLSGHFLFTGNEVDRSDAKDLFFKESDPIYEEEKKKVDETWANGF